MKTGSFTVIIVFIALSLIGCALIPLLPVKLAPSERLPGLTVSFSIPGNAAITVETEVTSRLESILSRVNGVKDITSRSYNGYGQVTVGLDRHTDIDKVRFEVSTLLRQAWSEMPQSAAYPSISTRQVDSENSGPFMTLTLNAPANPSEIQAYGEETLKPVLARIPGVAKIELNGAQPGEWKLYYDIDRLSAIGITPDEIRKAINQHLGSEFMGIGAVNGDSGEEWIRISLNSTGDKTSFRPAEIPVVTPAGHIMALDKLVTIKHEEATPTGYFRINGLNSIYVNISAEESANQLQLAEKIREALHDFKTHMPHGYMIDTVHDATREISGELSKIYFRTGMTVLILLLFVGLVSLNLNYVLLVTISLAINLAVASVLYYITGIEIQLYSLAGITISLNLIIDNIIVMTDHYTRRHNLNAFTAILAATLTTAGALSIVFFMDEQTRLSLQDFVAVVIINLGVSLLVSLFLVPALVDRLGIKRRAPQGKSLIIRRRLSLWLSRSYSRIVTFILRFRVAFIIFIILAFGLPVFLLPENVGGDSLWVKAYNNVFGSALYNDKIRPAVDTALGGTLRLFTEKVYNGSYWNHRQPEPVLHVYATLPYGATINQMNSLIQKMENHLSEYSGIRQFQTSISSARRASLTIYFTKESRYTEFPYRLRSEIIGKALTLGGGSWTINGLESSGFSNDVRDYAGNYGITLTGYNYDELQKWASRMCDTLLTHKRIREVNITPEYTYWRDDHTEFSIEIDRDRLARNGLTADRLFAIVKPTFGRDIMCGQVVTDGKNEKILLSSIQSGKYDVFALMQQPFTIGDKTVKLSEIGRLTKRQAPQSIIKKNQEYILCLQFNYIGSKVQADKILQQDVDNMNSMMPLGYHARYHENNYSRDNGTGKYLLLLLVIAIIFFISSILFNSLKQPFAIILMIPISFIGVFSIFYLFKLSFDQGGFASFILLAGITVNAAIYILNQYNTLRRRFPQVESRSLYLKAVRLKIVPILLTVISTVLGFIPFIVGDSRESFWYPLAIGTMGGLLMSLIAILIYLPVFVLSPLHKLPEPPPHASGH